MEGKENYHLKYEGSVIITEGVNDAFQIASLLKKWEVPFYQENSYLYIPREHYDIVCSDLKLMGRKDLNSSYR